MKRSAYAKLAALAIIEIAVVAAFSMPIQTHAVKLDMPTGPSHHAVQLVPDWGITLSLIAVWLFIVCGLAFPVWLAIRIVRRERATVRIPAEFS